MGASRKRGRKRAARSSPGKGSALDLGSDKLYFKIGEVSEIIGVPPYVLRYWETEFKAIRPQKSRAQQRVYRRRDVETLLRIKNLLYDQKFTIAGARQQLREVPDDCEMASPSGAYLARQSLQHIRTMLDELLGLIATDEDGTAADPAAFIQQRGGARAILASTADGGSAQPLLERPQRSEH